MKARINEIFSSIQGEGPVVGYKQLFIRFCGCNLNCEYCDTEFAKGVEYSPQELFEKITKEYNLKTFHSVSLTGGEPLLSADFLTEFLPLIKNKVKMYLETNATMPENLLRVKPYIDIISADIKLKSSTGLDVMKLHEKFFENCNGVDTFAKIVFDADITGDEISKCCILSEKYSVPLVLQPKMVENKMSVSSEFCEEVLEKFTAKCRNVRLIPQVHKFLNVR